MPTRHEPVTAYLGLGSNLGDRCAMMRAALDALDARPPIRVDRDRGVAPLYETSPVGGPAKQRPYLNSAVRIITTLTPHDLLAAAQAIEYAMGRTRGERWGSRIIDIDVLLYADLVIQNETLTLPHLRMHERRFVLEPLSKIATDVVHPAIGCTIAELARACMVGTGDHSVVRIDNPSGWPTSLEVEKTIPAPNRTPHH